MDAESMKSLQARLRANRTRVRTDEAARAALILPVIQALGYDIFDPEAVVPGFTRGQGRADFLVLDGEQHRMVISLTPDPTDLTTDRAVRLAECFVNVGATTAILTDGSLYRVHTDADQPGRMDEEPLLSVDLGGASDVSPTVLAGLAQDTFDIATLADAAKSRRYDDAVRRAVGDEIADPSEAFIDIIGNRMRTAGFEPRDDIFQRVSAISIATTGQATTEGASAPVGEPAAMGDERMLTGDEMLGYHIVRAIAARHGLDASRIVARPAQSYCAVLLDDNNRKSIARLHFNSQTVKYLGTFVDKKETRRQIQSPNGIYQLDEFIADRLRELDPKAFGLAETAESRSRDSQEPTGGEDEVDADAAQAAEETTVPDAVATETPSAAVPETTSSEAAPADPALDLLSTEPADQDGADAARARPSFDDGIDDERRNPEDDDRQED